MQKIAQSGHTACHLIYLLMGSLSNATMIGISLGKDDHGLVLLRAYIRCGRIGDVVMS